MQHVKKRDGRIVKFNKNKIVDAILKAFKQEEGEISDYALEKANNIADFIKNTSDEILTVAEIQDRIAFAKFVQLKLPIRLQDVVRLPEMSDGISDEHKVEHAAAGDVILPAAHALMPAREVNAAWNRLRRRPSRIKIRENVRNRPSAV